MAKDQLRLRVWEYWFVLLYIALLVAKPGAALNPSTLWSKKT